jgi:hypothetical protein
MPSTSPSEPRIFRLHRPERGSGFVTWSWEADSGLYARTHATIRLSGAERIPERLWATLAMVSMHTHWLLLRPCRVFLPYALPHGELAMWQRLLEAEGATLDAHPSSPAPGGEVTLVPGDLHWREPEPVGPGPRCATAFSGGRDSLVQTGLLLECTGRPLLVATTSPMPPLEDHDSARRREVFAAMASRPDLEFVEVDSDFRSVWDNKWPLRAGYPASVNCVTDALFYASVAAAAAYVRGVPRVYLASEREVSENMERDGKIVQFNHFMYSVPTQAAIGALLRPWGLSHGSLTSPLRGHHLQDLLWRRYPDLAALQYSCWRVGRNQAACNNCSKCMLCGFGAFMAGGDLGLMGMDLVRLLARAGRYEPVLTPGPDADLTPNERVTREHRLNILRYMRQMTPRRVLRHLWERQPGRLWRPGTMTALAQFFRARRRHARLDLPPPVPWNLADLAFVDPFLRSAVRGIYFESAPGWVDNAADAVHRNNRSLADRIVGGGL